MTLREAKLWVEKYFGSLRRFEASRGKPLEIEKFSEILEIVENYPKFLVKNHTAKELFLYAGCVKFNRWFAPSPPSVPEGYRDLEKRFAEALAAHEEIPMNAPAFLVHSIRDELYHKYGSNKLPLDVSKMIGLAQLTEALDQIPVPEQTEKKEEMLKSRSEVAHLIEGLRSGSLVTKLKTFLPYPLAVRPLQLQLHWEGLNTVIRVDSHFASPTDFMLQTVPPNVSRPMSTTRRQYGTSTVEIELPSLIDPSFQVQPLQIPAVGVATEAWPNGLKVAFEIIYRIFWALRHHPDYIGTWVPAPGDLGDIESIVVLNGQNDLGFIRRTNPSIVFNVFSPSTEPLTLDLGVAADIEWYKRCRVLADQYALLGEAREAIFWLNVGVESLLRKRMEDHISNAGVEVDLDVIDGGKSYWDEAKQLVVEKFPALADEIEWPSVVRKPSLFQQLKFYSSNVPGAPSLNPVKSHYSKVSQRRNALFHGSSEAPISIDDVRAAMESFDWLSENFVAS